MKHRKVFVIEQDVLYNTSCSVIMDDENIFVVNFFKEYLPL
jgi:hypothetical protein